MTIADVIHCTVENEKARNELLERERAPNTNVTAVSDDSSDEDKKKKKKKHKHKKKKKKSKKQKKKSSWSGSVDEDVKDRGDKESERSGADVVTSKSASIEKPTNLPVETIDGEPPSSKTPRSRLL